MTAAASPSPVVTAVPVAPSVVPETPPEPAPVAPVTAQAAGAVSPIGLTREGLEAAYEAAGVPADWREALAAIAWCESRWQPGAVGDSGNSLGLHQLWRGWFRPGEDPMDPVTNSRVAARVREIRGRFGGAGGWTCASILGIE